MIVLLRILTAAVWMLANLCNFLSSQTSTAWNRASRRLMAGVLSHKGRGSPSRHLPSAIAIIMTIIMQLRQGKGWSDEGISLLTKNLHRREGTEEISPAWRNSVRGSPGRGLTCRRSYPCQLTRSRCTPSRMRCKSRFVQKQTNVLMFCFVTLGAVVDTTWGFRMWPPIVIWTSRIVGSISIINTYSASSSEQIGLLW